MEIKNKTAGKVMLALTKDCFAINTISTLAERLKMTRVGIWKILNKLAAEGFIFMRKVGRGKTGAQEVFLNWENRLVEKSLAFWLAEEAAEYPRWLSNFKELQEKVAFVILYGSVVQMPQKANDIDVMTVTQKNNFQAIDAAFLKIQKMLPLKIHAINLTPGEWKKELKKDMPAYIDALKKGIILFGQESFISLLKEVYPR